jgi:phosphoribosylaminoimidazole-succinocarboxamide synthase
LGIIAPVENQSPKEATAISSALLQSELTGIPLFRRGKVRDVYDLNDRLLIVATDRISAFDCILPNPIPEKGRILTEMSSFWFGKLSSIVPNHIIETDVSKFPENLKPFTDQLTGRSMLVQKTQAFPVECVARGYLAGSGWKDYQKDGAVCGIPLPAGLRESDRLPEPLFTPATKAESGHDENISETRMAEIVGVEHTRQLKELTLNLYSAAAEYALSRGIILCDTKFEFGLDESGAIVWIDEALTPDSSRFWDAQTYEPGRSQDSFDKQFVRNYLETLDWDKQPPAPTLPDNIIEATRLRYLEALNRLTN